ncbi:MAG: late control D family protein [Lentisphaeria bacterium]|nr:late control D family protein [Lentisphaeria bacterium]
MPIPVIQTRLRLLYGKNGVDITESLLSDLLEFSYEDKETNEAEEISVKLKDDTGKWAGNWQPDGGDIIKAWIIPGNVDEPDNSRMLFCGEFYVDELSVGGMPRTFDMKAVSIPLNKPIRRKQKTRAWEKKTLKNIAAEIAADANIKLFFDSNENPEYDREEQNQESDLKFLSRLCEDKGLSIKVTTAKLVIFDQKSYESKKPIKTLTLGKSNILSYGFTMQQSETYRSCKVQYRDPAQKKAGEAAGKSLNPEKAASSNKAVLTYTYDDPLASEDGQEYTVNERVKSLEEAKKLAMATLRRLNARQTTGNMTIIGDTSLSAGCVIACKGFGKVDGNFIIESASHTVGGGGYTTALTLRRVNTKY